MLTGDTETVAEEICPCGVKNSHPYSEGQGVSIIDRCRN